MGDRLELRPATFFDALDFAGHRAFLRKALVYQVRHSEAYVVAIAGRPLALAMFWREACRPRRAEFCLIIKPDGQRHMLALVRMAHLTITRLVQGGLMVIAKVQAADARAHRMARLVGFTPGRLSDPRVWIFRRAADERSCGHGDGQGEQESRAGAAPTA